MTLREALPGGEPGAPPKESNMVVQDIVSYGAPIAAAAAVGAGFVWQMMRRRTVKPPMPSVEHRDPASGLPTANAAPGEGAEAKSQAVLDFEAVGPGRPTMLAVTAMRGDATVAEVFIQRAFKIDREYWRSLDIGFHEARGLDCLFANVNKLAWVPGSAFERHIYAVSFSPVLEEALRQGFHPRANAVASDLQICAIDASGVQMGEPMLMPDSSWGQPGRVHALWCALNPSDKEHPLKKELDAELSVLADHVGGILKYVSALAARNWQLRYDELKELADDFSRIGAETGPATERTARIDALENVVNASATRIDADIADRTGLMRTLEDTDHSLQYVTACIAVREVIVRIRRVLSILRVMGGDTLAHELHGATEIEQDITAFPDVKPVLAKAQQIADEALKREARTMNEAEIQLAGAVSQHAKELAQLHDAYFEQLNADVRRVQAELDRWIINQSHHQRYAVRVSDDGQIEDMFVLEH